MHKLFNLLKVLLNLSLYIVISSYDLNNKNNLKKENFEKCN